MEDRISLAPVLEPLAYHRAVVAQLQRTEPQIWAWAASQAAREDQDREARALLLRETYRMDAAAHPEIHATCAAVLTRLGIDAPVTLYQAGDGAMNAALCYIPGEIHLTFHGPILERLSPNELVALIGHELAHYKLWSIEDGAFHVATRILDHALAYLATAPSHAETARLYRLHTELYADRGGAVAADAPGPAISTLIKTMTGLGAVDVESYLRQAAELDAGGSASQGQTHPEVFLRAQALDKWWRGDADAETWIDSRLRGPLSMAGLDLQGQEALTALTRGFLARLAADPAAAGEAVATQLRRYFPDWSGAETPADDAALAPGRFDPSVRDYLTALSFDVAMADPDARDALLTAGGRLARLYGGVDGYRAALKRDLKLDRRAIDRLLAPAKEAAT